MEFFDLNWQQFFVNLVKMLIAFALTLPVAWNRERESRSVGMRTFPIVSVASCGFILLAIAALGLEAEAQARIIQGLMTGIGFVGGGAILKDGGSVHGTATAASIWATGVIGASTAYGRYEIAILVSILNFALLRFLPPVTGKIEEAVDEEERDLLE